MVGVPRSSGCLLCVQRRIKCDRGQPACLNCVRYKTQCPGYDRTFKFVSVKHKVRHRPKELSSAASSSDNGDAVSNASGSASSAGSLTAPFPVQQARLPTVILEPSRRDILLSLGQVLWDGTNEEFLTFQDWFSLIPDRLGCQALLDSGVYAFALHMRGLSEGNRTALFDARVMYTKSLSELQRALNHPQESRSSDTLCSAMLLCIFEMFAGTTAPGDWLKHAAGVGYLIEHRGPEAHRNEWDGAMLATFRIMLIMRALILRQPCFLSGKAWRSVSINNERSNFADPFYDNMAQMPDMVYRAHMARTKAEKSGYLDPEERRSLIHTARELRQNFDEALENLEAAVPPPEEQPNPYPDPLYPSILTFWSEWLGSLFMGMWSSQLILQSLLGELGHEEVFPESDQELLQKILKSFEYTSQGIMGPFRCGYAIRVAAEKAEGYEKAWVMRRLNKFTENFAAFRPMPALQEDGYDEADTNPVKWHPNIPLRRWSGSPSPASTPVLQNK